MPRSFLKTVLTSAAIAVVAATLLGGCEKRTTTVTTPTGTTTTTTVAPTPAAASAMGQVGDAVADAVLTTKVKTALLADDSVKGLRIDVDSRNGVVTLNGTADTLANVSRAESLAKSIDGVKSVQNRLSVAVDSATSSAAPVVTIDAATGSASAAVAKAGRALDQAADSAARAADKAGDALADAAITAKVKAAFLADTAVKGLRVEVDTRGGVVTLSGNLEQRANIDRAESIAKRIDGVKGVENRLVVKAPG